MIPLVKCPILIVKEDSNRGSFIRDVDIDLLGKLNTSVEEMEIKGVGHALFMQDRKSFMDGIVPCITNY